MHDVPPWCGSRCTGTCRSRKKPQIPLSMRLQETGTASASLHVKLFHALPNDAGPNGQRRPGWTPLVRHAPLPDTARIHSNDGERNEVCKDAPPSRRVVTHRIDCRLSRPPPVSLTARPRHKPCANGAPQKQKTSMVSNGGHQRPVLPGESNDGQEILSADWSHAHADCRLSVFRPRLHGVGAARPVGR